MGGISAYFPGLAREPQKTATFTKELSSLPSVSSVLTTTQSRKGSIIIPHYLGVMLKAVVENVSAGAWNRKTLLPPTTPASTKPPAILPFTALLFWVTFERHSVKLFAY